MNWIIVVLAFLTYGRAEVQYCQREIEVRDIDYAQMEIVPLFGSKGMPSDDLQLEYERREGDCLIYSAEWTPEKPLVPHTGHVRIEFAGPEYLYYPNLAHYYPQGYFPSIYLPMVYR